MKLICVNIVLFFFAGLVQAMDFKYLKCKTTGVEEGHRFDVRIREGHLAVALSAFKGKQEENVRLSERSMVHAVALKNSCELHVFSRHPQDFVFQFQTEYRDFDRKKIRHNIELRGQWDYRHDKRNAGGVFYRLVECEFNELVLPKDYVATCGEIPQKPPKIEYGPRKNNWNDYDYGNGGSSGAGGGADR